MRTRMRFGALALGVATLLGCTGGPGAPSSPVGAIREGGSGVQALNTPPQLLWQTQPRADLTTLPYPTVTGFAPLNVKFNLCRSDDVEQIIVDGYEDPRGDSLNWQFHFGDTGRPAYDEAGNFKPDFEHFCRTEHEFRAGEFIVTMVVSDKHVEDQGGPGAQARREQRVRILSLPQPEPTATGGPCEIESFDVENFFDTVSRRVRASSAPSDPALFDWTTTGSVVGATLFVAPGVTHVVVGDPANRSGYQVDNAYEDCFDYVLTVTCGDGTTRQTTAESSCG